jgi:hypothetical protein
MMHSRGRAIALSALILGLVGCGSSGTRCEQLIDRNLAMATKMIREMGPSSTLIDDLKKDRPAAIKRCEERLRNDRDGKASRAIDCVLAAENLEEAAACEGRETLDSVR